MSVPVIDVPVAPQRHVPGDLVWAQELGLAQLGVKVNGAKLRFDVAVAGAPLHPGRPVFEHGSDSMLGELSDEIQRKGLV